MSGQTVYEVTRDGRVLSLSGWHGERCRELAQYPNDYGYPCVRLVIDGKRIKKAVHRLVAQKYLPERPSDDHELRHLDGNKANNHADNLAWGTAKENAADRERHGRTSRGAKHSAAIKANLPPPHNKGKTITIEQRIKIGNAMRGRPWSEKRRAALLAKVAPQTKEKA